MRGWEIHIEGRVQGVGFRPLVYRLARELGLRGRVSNGVDGVRILVAASKNEASTLLTQIEENLPPAAIITSANLMARELEAYVDFSIDESPQSGQPKLMLTPDLALCADCRTELTGENRRRGYAFTTCTNCGPRYSISTALPYDRPRTTMVDFKMCPDCKTEYNDPTNRRHFSQTNSCPSCAIDLQILSGPTTGLSGHAILQNIVEHWRAGKIVAIKGIGGFLLTCDATNASAIQELRRRKHRPHKPLAVMMRTNEVARLVTARPQELSALNSLEAPIVLLPPKEAGPLAMEAIAPGLDRVGVMLPYTPLYELLLAEFDGPIVATSGNISGEPIVYQDEEAAEKLGQVADLIVGNNRDILVPQDDSVIQFTQRGQKIFLRRSRGYAPAYLPGIKSLEADNILAVGADMKATFGLQQSGNTYLSQYLGDLGSYTTQAHYQRTLDHLWQLIRTQPERIVCDLHPAYVSTGLATSLAQKMNLPLEQIQHHEAHFAAVLLENELLDSDQAVLGVIWDGTGYGHDGKMWGGELMTYQSGRIDRVGQLAYFPHLAGDKLAKEPRLSALAVAGDLPIAVAVLRPKFSATEWKVYQKMREITQLQSSSTGRLFDAVASLLGVADTQSYEGMAATRLEVLARQACDKLQVLAPYEITLGVDQQIPGPELIIALLKDEASTAVRALRFHLTLVEMIRQMAEKQQIHHLAFSGGVFQNALLVDLVVERLGSDFSLYFHKSVSPNDEGIALGQLAHYAMTQKLKLSKKIIMCLAIPGKIKSIRYEYDGKIKMAKVSFGGIVKDATLDMVPDAEVGDYVLVHVGVAISKVDEIEAKRVFEYLEQMGETDELHESDYVPGQVDAVGWRKV